MHKTGTTNHTSRMAPEKPRTANRMGGGFAAPSHRRPWVLRLAGAVLAALAVAACTPHPYELKHVAKSDTNMVADAHLQEMERLMRLLMAKLYRRNPVQLMGRDLEGQVSRIFDRTGELRFAELDYRQGEAAIALCFDESYAGDRVFALMTGLAGMIRKSYNGQTEFFILDTLDQQKLYNSARNIEILVWRLGNRLDSHGLPFLLTNSLAETERNLSFERLFGKMIAIQDMMARIMEDRTHRLINKVVTSAASAFLPVGF